jgi:cobalt-zinc-cadmium efflux system protein
MLVRRLFLGGTALPHQVDHSDAGHRHAEHSHADHCHAEHLHARHSHAGHSHAHAPKDFGRIFAIVTFLNFALVMAQVVYGLKAQSVALLADAGHNFGDAIGLVLAWGAHALARRTPTRHYTYGFRSASILAALLNAVILLVATGAIVLEALHRLFWPAEVAGGTVMIVAAIGIVINGLSAWLLRKGAGDLNVHGAFLHMLADMGVSVGVVLAGAGIVLTGWLWLDPAMSLVVSAVIVWGAWGLLRDAGKMSLAAVPPNIDPMQVRAHLEGRAGVEASHDLHIWAMSTTETALTCHLVMPKGHPGDAFLAELCHELQHRFGIGHVTLQIELGDAGACKLAPDHVV